MKKAVNKKSPKNSLPFNAQRKNIILELHPKGYCRMTEVATLMQGKRELPLSQLITKRGRSKTPKKKSKRNDDCIRDLLLGIGRWKKRPWGVTIIVQPVPIVLVYDGIIHDDAFTMATEGIIDENIEFVFHAKEFYHSNRSGTMMTKEEPNPKLQRGTIMIQNFKKHEKIKSSDDIFCWKSTTSSYTSMLPISQKEKFVVPSQHNILDSMNDIVYEVFCRNYFGTDCGWFRPICGTFSARGIVK